jgi:ABC-type sugar transport system substrate-binding protein
VNGLSQSILKAKEKGIPVFILDAEIDTDGAYSVTVGQDELVNTSLEWMFNKIGGTGDFAYFDFQPDNNQAAIIEELLKKYPDIKVVTKDTAKYNFNENKSYVSSLMTDFPDLKAIWANESLSTIVLGMADTGIPSEKWPLLTCEPTKDGLFIWKDRLKDHQGMQCIAVSNPPGMAYDAVYAAYYLINGAKIDETALGGQYGRSLNVDALVVTNDQLPEWLNKIEYEDGKYVLDTLMEPKVIKERWFLE